MRTRLRSLAKTFDLTRGRLMSDGSESRKSIGYIGGHGGGNLGDDLMTCVATKMFPEHRLVDIAESWHEKRLAKVRLSGRGFFDQVIVGGGTLISPFWYGKVETAVSQGLRVSTLGTGAGSCGFIQPDAIDLSNWAPLLRRFHRLGLRGPRSCRRLAELGVEHAEVVGDLALYLTPDAVHPATDPPIAAVNLSLPASDDPQYEECERFREVATVMGRLVAEGWQVRPYAMHKPDVAPTRELMASLGLHPNAEVPHLSTVDAFFDYVGPATLNVAVRLHGAILGCCVGVPPLMLAYRDKGVDFMESMALEHWCIYLPAAQAGEVEDRLRELAQQATGLREAVHERSRHWKMQLTRYSRELADAPQAA